jgi:hypothetical protein
VDKPITHIVYGNIVLPIVDNESLDEIVTTLQNRYFTLKQGVSFLKVDTILFVKPAELEHQYTIYQEGMEL